jgi:hypothetical protein
VSVYCSAIDKASCCLCKIEVCRAVTVNITVLWDMTPGKLSTFLRNMFPPIFKVWRQQVPARRPKISTRPHGITSYKTRSSTFCRIKRYVNYAVWDTVVGVVTRLRAGRQRTRDSTPGRGCTPSLPHSASSSGAYQNPYL